MNDEELLELAALAGGIQFRGYDLWYEDFSAYDPEMDCNYKWNPLDDDGDALRLAVKLGMTISSESDVRGKDGYCRVVADWSDETGYPRVTLCEKYNGDSYAATRYAIVRAAAEIGKSMKGKQ